MVLVVGAVAASVLVISFVKGVAGPLSRFTTTSPVEVDLRAGAERTIYRGSPDTTFGTRVSCRVTEAATGQEIPVRLGGGFTLTLGDEEYVSAAAFEAPRAGRYRVTCSSDSAGSTPMAVGPRIRVARGVATIFAAIAIGLVSVALTAVIAVLTAVRRHQSRQSRQSLGA